jgi:putative oxidoreductase
MTMHDRELRLQRYGLGVLRVALGTIFMAHGAQKLFTFGLAGTAGAFGQIGLPFPTVSATLVIVAELLGGVLLLLGFLTRLAAVPLVVTMVVATLAVHLPNGFFLPDGFEFTLALLGGSVAILLGGPGAWALDRALWRTGDPLTDWTSARSEEEGEGRLRRAA